MLIAAIIAPVGFLGGPSIHQCRRQAWLPLLCQNDAGLGSGLLAPWELQSTRRPL